MQYLFLVGSLLILAVWAPPAATALVLAGIVLNAMIVKVTTATVADLQVSFGDALKAIGYSLAFLLLAVFTLFSFLFGTEAEVSGLAALALFSTIFVAYILGFSVALSTSFGTSAVVALVSTLASGVLIFVGRSIVAS